MVGSLQQNHLAHLLETAVPLGEETYACLCAAFPFWERKPTHVNAQLFPLGEETYAC